MNKIHLFEIEITIISRRHPGVPDAGESQLGTQAHDVDVRCTMALKTAKTCRSFTTGTRYSKVLSF
jgi:hypothetical protein